MGGGFLQAEGGGQEGGFVGQALRAGQFAPRGPGGLEDGAVASQQLDGGVALRRGVDGWIHGITY